ncbi:MAG: Dna2/Cas4 domain-containing protein [Bacteroidales bacterium]|nr:Dna2/Cas4 domain-containing protein [Bacteroidales bacterium]
MEKHILSKSTFIKGYHCLKSLYLHKKRPFLRDRITAEQRAKFKRGHKVGDLAQDLFPGGIDVSPKSPSQYQKSAVHTGELIEQGQEVIYEATFQFNKVLVMLDLLIKTKDGWNAYEVKSSKSLSETYFTDAALQYYVIENSGLKINKFYLVYVDEQYRRLGDLDIQKYFIKQDVTEDLKPRQEFIGEKIAEEMEMLQEKHSPKVAVGDHCFAPYKCDFVGFCWKKISDKPYLPKPINAEGVLPNKPKDSIALSLIFSEQAIPECENEIAYFQKGIGFKVGNNEAVISGKTCEEKEAFLQAFFEQIENDKSYIIYEISTMNQWLDDITIQFPEFIEKINSLKENTLGILESLIKAGQVDSKNRTNYSLAYLSKEVLKDETIVKSAIYSDILAGELFGKMEPDLWGDDSPDLESLQQYLEEKMKVTVGLFGEF